MAAKYLNIISKVLITIVIVIVISAKSDCNINEKNSNTNTTSSDNDDYISYQGNMESQGNDTETRSVGKGRHLFQNTQGVSWDHPCRRKCLLGRHMTCYYRMVVHYDTTMGPTCRKFLESTWDSYESNNNNGRKKRFHSGYDPEYKKNYNLPPDCIYADGVKTGIMVVNGMLPGQSIEVCQGDTIVAEVFNRLHEETTIHWHGMHMTHSPDMDGAPFVTQYPIYPAQTFCYTFKALDVGTNWWHSHSQNQRAFGVAGPLIVRQPSISNPHIGLYDYDIFEHIMILHDWVHDFNQTEPQNILINGKGRDVNPFRLNKPPTRYETFTVKHGYRYRFRVIYNGIGNCPLKLSVDKHVLLVIATDGKEIEPVEVTSIIFLAAERYDFVLIASKPVKNYWIRVKAYGFCASRRLIQEAILHYKNANRYTMPEGESLSYEYEPIGPILNPMDTAPTGDPEKITVPELNAIKPVEWPKDCKFITYYISLGIFVKNGEFSLQQDHITFEPTTLSLLQSRFLNIERLFCNKTTLAKEGRDCINTKCQCTNVIHVPAYHYIEFMLTSTSATGHPFHTHGYNFRVVGGGILGPVDVFRIEEIDKATPLPRRYYGAPIKDTIQVPGRGYVIIRFKSYNPGYWMMHCHIHVHQQSGMMSVLKVGEPYQMKSSSVVSCKA